MNKRGQIFILAAVIIVAFIVLVTTTYNSYNEEVALEDFDKLSQNYESEAPKVINNAIENEEDEVEALSDFTDYFSQYANQKDPGFGIVYFFKDSKGDVHIFNSLNNKQIIIEYLDPEYDASMTSLSLLSADASTQGSVCTTIGGFASCVNAETDIGNFGETLYSANLEGVEKLCVKIDGIPGDCQDIFLSGFKSMEFSEEADPLYLQGEDSDPEDFGTSNAVVRIKYPEPEVPLF